LEPFPSRSVRKQDGRCREGDGFRLAIRRSPPPPAGSQVLQENQEENGAKTDPGAFGSGTASSAVHLALCSCISQAPRMAQGSRGREERSANRSEPSARRPPFSETRPDQLPPLVVGEAAPELVTRMSIKGPAGKGRGALSTIVKVTLPTPTFYVPRRSPRWQCFQVLAARKG